MHSKFEPMVRSCKCDRPKDRGPIATSREWVSFAAMPARGTKGRPDALPGRASSSRSRSAAHEGLNDNPESMGAPAARGGRSPDRMSGGTVSALGGMMFGGSVASAASSTASPSQRGRGRGGSVGRGRGQAKSSSSTDLHSLPFIPPPSPIASATNIVYNASLLCHCLHCKFNNQDCQHDGDSHFEPKDITVILLLSIEHLRVGALLFYHSTKPRSIISLRFDCVDVDVVAHMNSQRLNQRSLLLSWVQFTCVCISIHII
jgi:hypothetical protein